MSKEIDYNIKVHNKVAKKYHTKHPEIYNEVEQKRLSQEIRNALLLLNKDFAEINALDYGCGAGNISYKLLDLGVNVTSADISEEFLKLIKKNADSNRLSTILLNGKDLSNIQDNYFDIVFVYSVLHHIPDYLSAIKEMCRVVKSGGLLFIDHERNSDFWNPNKHYIELQELTKPKFNPLI